MILRIFVCLSVATGLLAADINKASSGHGDDRWLLIWGGGRRPEDVERFRQLFKYYEPIMGDVGIAVPDGYPKLFESDDHPGLNSGFFILVLGVCDEERAKELNKKIGQLYKGFYIKKLEGSGLSFSCPKLSKQNATDRSGKSLIEEKDMASISRALFTEVFYYPELQRLFSSDMRCFAAWGLDCARGQRKHQEALAGSRLDACHSILGLSTATAELLSSPKDSKVLSVSSCVADDSSIAFALARREGLNWQVVDAFPSRANADCGGGKCGIGVVDLNSAASENNVICIEREVTTASTLYGGGSYDGHLYCYWATGKQGESTGPIKFPGCG